MLLNADTSRWTLTLANPAVDPQFAQDVANVRGCIRAMTGTTWLLQQPHRRDFSVWLVALLAERKVVLLPSNGQPQTLQRLLPLVDHSAPLGLPDSPNTNVAVEYVITGDINQQLILYTSGSSGEPKPICKSLSQLFREVATLEATFGQQIGNAMVVPTITHQHIYGLIFTVLWPLCTGRQVSDGQLDYPEQWQILHHRSNQPYIVVSSPTQLERYAQVIDFTGYDRTMRLVFSSGGPLAAEVPYAFVKANLAAPVEVYGSTETGGIAWRQRSTPEQSFTLFEGVCAQLTAENVLQISSPHLADTCMYTTSDRVQFIGDQQFIILGRNDRIVKLTEKRVSLDEIESHAEALDWVAQAQCVLLDKPPRQQLGLVIVVNHDHAQWVHQQQRLALRQLLRQHLSQYFDTVVLPRKFRYVERLPHNDAGKITQASLLQLFSESYPS